MSYKEARALLRQWAKADRSFAPVVVLDVRAAEARGQHVIRLTKDNRLLIVGEPAIEKVVSCYKKLSATYRNLRWALGYTLVLLEAITGDMFYQYIDDEDMSYSSMTKAVAVARRFPPGRLRPQIRRWSYYYEITRDFLSDEDQDWILDKVISNGWQREDIRQAVQEIKRAKGIDSAAEEPDALEDTSTDALPDLTAATLPLSATSITAASTNTGVIQIDPGLLFATPGDTPDEIVIGGRLYRAQAVEEPVMAQPKPTPVEVYETVQRAAALYDDVFKTYSNMVFADLFRMIPADELEVLYQAAVEALQGETPVINVRGAGGFAELWLQAWSEVARSPRTDGNKAFALRAALVIEAAWRLPESVRDLYPGLPSLDNQEGRSMVNNVCYSLAGRDLRALVRAAGWYLQTIYKATTAYMKDGDSTAIDAVLEPARAQFAEALNLAFRWYTLSLTSTPVEPAIPPVPPLVEGVGAGGTIPTLIENAVKRYKETAAAWEREIMVVDPLDQEWPDYVYTGSDGPQPAELPKPNTRQVAVAADPDLDLPALGTATAGHAAGREVLAHSTFTPGNATEAVDSASAVILDQIKNNPAVSRALSDGQLEIAVVLATKGGTP